MRCCSDDLWQWWLRYAFWFEVFLRVEVDPFHFLDLDWRIVFEFYRSNIIPFEKEIFDITPLKNLLYNKKINKQAAVVLKYTRLLTVVAPSEVKGQPTALTQT